MDDIAQMMAQDAQQAIPVPTDEKLKMVSDLANRQVYLEANYREDQVLTLIAMDPSVLELEEALKQKKEELAKIKEFDLPNALEAVGLTECRLTNGGLVSVKEDVYAGITEENREGAYSWLAETGNDGIIKNEVKCPFGKGQDAEAKALAEMLTQQGFSYTNSRTIHPQTLKAFVRKQLEDGQPIPTDLFSIHIKKVASIKSPIRQPRK